MNAGNEHLLHQIVGIGVLKPLATGQAMDHGPINLRKLRPRLVIGPIFQADQKARSSFR